MPLAFAPFHFWFIAIIAITGLLLIWENCDSKSQFFLTGWLFGLGYFGVGISWVYISLHEFGNALPIVAGLITVLLIFWQALYIGLLALAYRQIQKAFSKYLAYLLLPVLWFSMEWLKGVVLTGFPWLSVGYSQIDSPYSMFAPWIGTYGLSMVAVAISVVFLLLISKTVKQYKTIFVIYSTFLIVFIGISQVEQTQPVSESLKITQVQGNIPQHVKWQRSKRQFILETYWEETKRHWDSDLIVWPETAVPGKSELIEESVILPMSMIAAEQQTNVLFGVLVSDLAKRRYFNSMLMVGENQGLYHKRHLVPFGEYMPLRWLLEFTSQFIQIPMSDMQEGDLEQPLMSINGVNLGVSICYEDVFSRDINKDLPEANILVNTSNDAWFGDSLAPHQHLQIAQMRALETGRPMVRSTNTGITAFIDYKGNITQQTKQFEVASITSHVAGRTGKTFFVLIEPYQWLIVVLTILIIFISIIKSKNKAEF